MRPTATATSTFWLILFCALGIQLGSQRIMTLFGKDPSRATCKPYNSGIRARTKVSNPTYWPKFFSICLLRDKWKPKGDVPELTARRDSRSPDSPNKSSR